MEVVVYLVFGDDRNGAGGGGRVGEGEELVGEERSVARDHLPARLPNCTFINVTFRSRGNEHNKLHID